MTRDTDLKIVNLILSRLCGHFIHFRSIEEEEVRVNIDGVVYRIGNNLYVEEMAENCLYVTSNSRKIETLLKR